MGTIGDATSIQAAAQHVPLADASWEVGRRSGYLRAGSAALNLGPTAVAKLGAQRQKLLWRFFWRQQPVGQTVVRDRETSGGGAVGDVTDLKKE